MKIMGKHLAHRLTKPVSKGYLFLIIPIIFGLFVIGNLVSYVYFANRAYPHTSIGQAAVGGKSFSGITAMPAEKILPVLVTVSAGENRHSISTSALGASIDPPATADNIKAERSFLPFLNFLKPHVVKPAVIFDEARLNTEGQRLSSLLSTPPADAKITRTDGNFGLVPSKEGSQAEPMVVMNALKTALLNGSAIATVAAKRVKPAITTEAIKPVYESIIAQQKTPLTFTYGQKTVQPSARIIGGWYVEQGGTFVLSDSLIRSYIRQLGNGWGIGVENLEAAVSETKKAVQSSRKMTYALIAKKVLRTYRYCTAVRGVDSSFLSAFNAKLAGVYANASGWSLEGQVLFEKAASGCNFTAWLAAAGQMTSFGGACDSTWSCRSGNNVIINFERWQNATTAWNNAGGNLEDYRTMVINHETGHWLGFGHQNCGGVGQLAPVMQQQSIDLQGCKFNPWPLSSELNVFRPRIS